MCFDPKVAAIAFRFDKSDLENNALINAIEFCCTSGLAVFCWMFEIRFGKVTSCSTRELNFVPEITIDSKIASDFIKTFESKFGELPAEFTCFAIRPMNFGSKLSLKNFNN